MLQSRRVRTAAGTALLAAAGVMAALPAAHAQGADSAAFVTRLGADTLVIERFVRRGNEVRAEVLMRVPRTTLTRYALTIGPGGGIQKMEARTFASAVGTDSVVARETITREGDSLRIKSEQGGQVRTRTTAADAATLPFIDMVHWPFEVALTRTRAARKAGALPLLSGSRVVPFTIEDRGARGMGITHPSRGTMDVTVDASGRIRKLDAGRTTRKLVVDRREWSDLAPVARRWMALDAAGSSVRALSGRADTTAMIDGAALSVDYGTPHMRGREIWGTLVPYGEVWRTGANEATHFTTDRDLTLGSGADTLHVPAGRYTLFSIPAADGGLLIVNRQTGQTGTAYDAARDLGRVKLSVHPLASPVEVFTIRITDEPDGGTIRLQWDGAERVVRFRVR